MQFIRKHLFAYITTVTAVTFAALFCANLYASATAVSAAAEALRTTIVIDAGHGGEDGGAVSPDGVRESALNLEIAMRLNDMLHLIGYETQMIRTADVSIHSSDAGSISEKKISDLKNRVQIVNAAGEALLVSIHQNMFQEAKYDGMQVFYAQTGGSKMLAESVQALVSAALDPGNRRAAKPAESVYLMNEIRCTGILVECGFLSNPAECRKLQTPEYQKQIVLVLADGLQDYLRKVHTNEV